MSGIEKLREGKLDDALREVQDQVRQSPAESKHRIFLFQLLAVQGQWDRAMTQLNVAAEMDPSALAMAQMYREALKVAVFRREVFAGERSPLIFGEPPEWVGWLIQAHKLLVNGETTASQEMRDRAFDQAPATSGKIDGQVFQWIADADPRLGPILEIIVNGRYYWAPFENIRRIEIEEPEDLRDFVWMPAHFQWANGGEIVGIIPTRYPGSENSEDELVRSARKTIWVEQTGELYFGLGQRMFATDEGEFPLMDTRLIELDSADQPANADNRAESTDG